MREFQTFWKLTSKNPPLAIVEKSPLKGRLSRPLCGRVKNGYFSPFPHVPSFAIAVLLWVASGAFYLKLQNVVLLSSAFLDVAHVKMSKHGDSWDSMTTPQLFVSVRYNLILLGITLLRLNDNGTFKIDNMENFCFY